MKNRHLPILTLSAVSVSVTADVNKSHFPTGAYFNLGGSTAAVDDATDAIPLQEDSSGIVADCVGDDLGGLIRELKARQRFKLTRKKSFENALLRK